MIEFKKISGFPRGTLYEILADAYSFDERNRQIWDANWKEADDFFYDNPEIAGKYGLVTCLDSFPLASVYYMALRSLRATDADCACSSVSSVRACTSARPINEAHA